MGINEMDRPLNFHGNSEIMPDGTGVVMVARGNDWIPANSISAFGLNGGEAANKYATSVRRGMHHECEYSPCRRLSPEEYERERMK